MERKLIDPSLDEIALIRACLLTNDDADAQAIEQEFDAIADPIAEPWTDSSE